MKAKIYIITGFLGAGKTTLLKRILSFSDDLSKTVVLVNEFGKVGIDKSLINSTAAADIVQLSSGCICCSLKTDMIQALQIIRHEYSPEHIVIEATGVADPLSIIDILKDKLIAPFFCLQKTITVVDGDFWEAREAFGTVFKSQLNTADMVLLNKIDMLDPSDVPVILKEIKNEYSKHSIIPSVHCNIDPDLFWADQETQDDKSKSTSTSFLNPYDPANDVYSTKNSEGALSAEAAGFITFSFESSKILDEEQFIKFLDRQPLELFRIKGPVRFSNKTRMLNYVGTKQNWQPWPDTRTTRLAFIGWGVIEEQITAELNRCLV